MASFRTLFALSSIAVLFRPIFSASTGTIITCPSYTEDFGIAVAGVSESLDGSCDCAETALIGLVGRCASVIDLTSTEGQVTCTPNDECACYTRTASEGQEAAAEGFAAPQVAVQLGSGPFSADKEYMWAFGGSPGQVILALPDAPLRCVLQLGGDAPVDGSPTPEAEEDEDEDEDDGSEICIEASRIPSEFERYLVHSKPIPASVFCVEGSDMPCGTQHHALVVDGERTSYGEFCKNNKCWTKRALVNAVFRHRWVEGTYKVAGEKQVIVPMGDFRYPDVLYAAAHYVLDAGRQMQTMLGLHTVSRVQE